MPNILLDKSEGCMKIKNYNGYNTNQSGFNLIFNLVLILKLLIRENNLLNFIIINENFCNYNKVNPI